MGEKLTKAQRRFLQDLEKRDLCRLPGSVRAMAMRLRKRRLVKRFPETKNLFEAWRITDAGRAALQEPKP